MVWGRVKRQKALNQFTPVSTISAADSPSRSNGSEVRDVCIVVVTRLLARLGGAPSLS